MKVKCFIFLMLLVGCSGEEKPGNHLASTDPDKGLYRNLPPPSISEMNTNDVVVNKRNIMVVLVDSLNCLRVNGEMMNVGNLKDKAKEFIANPNDSENLPSKEAVQIPILGMQVITSKYVIYLNNERGTSYQFYLEAKNELLAAYNELRNELSISKFGGRAFDSLTSEEQEAVKQYYPLRIVEGAP